MRRGMMYKQKDVVLMPFPYTDLTGKKLRPALIISNNKINATNDRLCVLITSNKAENALLIPKKHQREGALPLVSFIKPHRLFSINKNIIQKKLCKVSDELYKEVLQEIHAIIK